MAKYRRGRINDSVAQETSLILREVKDPRVSGELISITGADVTADLKYAKIYYSIFSNDEESHKEAAKGLKSANAFIRGQLAHRLNLRITPELTFIEDNGAKHGADIAAILKKIAEESKPEAAQEEDDE